MDRVINCECYRCGTGLDPEDVGVTHVERLVGCEETAPVCMGCILPLRAEWDAEIDREAQCGYRDAPGRTKARRAQAEARAG